MEGQQLEAAKALAEFLMSREAQQSFAAENGWPAVRDDAYAEVPDHLQETFDAVNQALDRASTGRTSPIGRTCPTP